MAGKIIQLSQVGKLKAFAFIFLIAYLVIILFHFIYSGNLLDLKQLIITSISFVALLAVLFMNNSYVDWIILIYLVGFDIIAGYGFFNKGSIFNFGTALGQFLALALPISLFLSLARARFRLFYLFSLILGFSALVYSGNRAGLVAFILSVLFVLIYARDRIKLTKKQVFFSLIFLVIVLLVFSLTPLRFLHISSGEFLGYRPRLWQNSLASFSLFGSGILFFTMNAYLQILLDAGVIALILFFILVYYLIKSTRPMENLSGFDYYLALGLFSGIMAFLIQGLVESSLGAWHVGILFWVQIALLIKLLEKNENKNK